MSDKDPTPSGQPSFQAEQTSAPSTPVKGGFPIWTTSIIAGIALMHCCNALVAKRNEKPKAPDISELSAATPGNRPFYITQDAVQAMISQSPTQLDQAAMMTDLSRQISDLQRYGSMGQNSSFVLMGNDGSQLTFSPQQLTADNLVSALGQMNWQVPQAQTNQPTTNAASFQERLATPPASTNRAR